MLAGTAALAMPGLRPALAEDLTLRRVVDVGLTIPPLLLLIVIASSLRGTSGLVSAGGSAAACHLLAPASGLPLPVAV